MKVFLLSSICLISQLFSQNIITIAGTGVYGYSGDNIPANTSQLMQPKGLAMDALGNLYIADPSGNRIRKISPSGIVTTIAGNGSAGFSGDGGAAINAQLSAPYDVDVDANGNLYIADGGNFRIRKVSNSGIITTIGGNGTGGFSGDGGQATSASFFYPVGIAVDGIGRVYVADWGNNRIRVIDPSGIINTFAGNGSPSYSGDGGPAVSASLFYPEEVCADNFGNVFIADRANDVIRKVNTAGVISTYAGNISASFYVEGAQATTVAMDSPIAVTADAFGNVYLIIENFNRICKVSPSGIITTISGPWFPNGYGGDGGPAISAKFYYPRGLVTDAVGNLYIADEGNSRVREVCVLPAANAGLIQGNGFVCPNSNSIYSISPVQGATSYSWNLPTGWGGSSITNTISVIPNTIAGTISVTAINKCGQASATSTFAVSLNSVPNVSITSINTFVCSGSMTTLNALGANSYTWSTGSNSISISISPTATSNYSLIGTGSNGCNGIAAITLSVKPLPILNCFASDYIFCSGESSTLTGNGAVSYTLQPGSLNGSISIVAPITNQTYTLYGTAANSCINKTTITLTVEPTPSVSSTALFYLCSGTATLNAQGADTYTWIPGNLNGSIALVSPTITTNYTVIGTVGSCTNTSVSNVSLGVAPPLTLFTNKTSGCKGTCFTFSYSSLFSGLTYDWGDGTTIPSLYPLHCYTTSGNYQVLAQGYYTSGCSVASNNTLIVTVFPTPTVSIGLNTLTPNYVNSNIAFQNETLGGQLFEWDLGDSSAKIATFSYDDIVHSYTPAGIYCAKLWATDTVLGCKDSSILCFEISCISDIRLPNVFTPNSDGVNEVFKFENECIKSLHCIIYNRWGIKMYEWEGPRGWWDGRTDSGIQVPSGVYFYILEYIDEKGNPQKKNGSISLFKD